MLRLLSFFPAEVEYEAGSIFSGFVLLTPGSIFSGFVLLTPRKAFDTKHTIITSRSYGISWNNNKEFD